MTPDEREQMFILCQRLAVEQDPHKFLAYTINLQELLQRKAERFKARDEGAVLSTLSGG